MKLFGGRSGHYGRRMGRRPSWREAGFSLIELILVMAITSSLVVIAFVGQRGLRSQAQFNADVDKLVANVAAARNEANAGVNVKGGGDGMPAGCGGGDGYVFAGLALTADNALPGSAFNVDYYEAGPTSAAAPTPTAACIFDSRSISVPSSLQLSSGGGRMLFVRNSAGGLVVCPVSSLATDVRPSFELGACSAGIGSFPFTLNLQDGDGHTSQVQIDSSGLAKRLN
jgi:prepilin-type N-terminal cleavage/methylation domain-containing protein